MACDDGTETWRPIPRFDGYHASSLGRIRGRRDTIVAQHVGSRGYLIVSMWTVVDGERKRVSKLSHRVIAAAFFGECPPRMEVNHRHGIKTDNRVTELEYVTKGQNEHHAHQTGLKSHTGIRNPATGLNEDDVRTIRRLYTEGNSQRVLARHYGISQPAVSLIVSRKNWSHVV